MGPNKKLGLISPAALALIYVSPAAAQTESADSSAAATATDTSEISSLIASDPDMRFAAGARDPAHGYWIYLGGSCPPTADVAVNLHALGCSSLGCTWITQATDTAVGVTPGSGTGHWATPHKTCANSNLVAWRGEAYTGLSNFWHSYGPDYGPAVDHSCSLA